MDLARVPPYDAMSYFSAPVEEFFSGPPAGTMLAPADPNRVLLIITSTNGAQAPVTTVPGVTNSAAGLWLTSGEPNLILTYETHGSLVNAAWYSGESALSSYNVLSVSLSKAIGDNKTPLASITPPRNVALASPPIVGRLAALWHRLTGR